MTPRRSHRSRDRSRRSASTRRRPGDAAVAGRERDRLDPGVRHRRPARADRGRDQGLRPADRRLAEGGAEARALRADLAVARREGGARRLAASPTSTRTRVGIIFGSAIGGVTRIAEEARSLRERGPDRVAPSFLPSVLVDTASGQIAISLGIKGLNYAIVSACATGSHAIGEAAEVIKRGDADAVIAGGVESCVDPLILAGFTAMRGLAAEDEYPPRASRPFDATRAGFVIGEGAGAVLRRGLGSRRGARRRDLRRGARLRRLERRAPPRAARARGRRRRGDDAARARPRRRRAGARRLHQRARHLHPARRPRGDEGDQGRVRRPRLQARGLARRSR